LPAVGSARELLEVALSHPLNAVPCCAVLCERLATLRLPQCHLVAGCLYQTFWNWLSGRPLDFGIKDYDVFYFQPDDLSWDAEDAVIRRVRAETAELGIEVEVKNQASSPLVRTALRRGSSTRPSCAAVPRGAHTT
jgi:hypothetical protein